MPNGDWMIYGATGYTGRLIAEAAAKRGLKPVLAGRSQSALHALGQSLKLPTRVFGLEGDVASHLSGMRLVLHCAGPFSATYRPMIEACLQSKVHYLDITGEIPVYEDLQSRRAQVAEAGITAVSGVGFDVVPTDCLAALLQRELPDATHLTLALSGIVSASPGTAKTVMEGLPAGGCVRKDGQLVQVPSASKTREVPFGDKASLAVLAPLADVSSAFYSTGIPNIEVYLKADAMSVAAMKAAAPLAPLLGFAPVQHALKQLAGWASHGPNASQRESARTVVWGQVENKAGQRVSMRLHTPEAYALTVDAALAAAEAVLAGEAPVGVGTPATAFGADFVLSLPGVTLERVTS